MSRLLAYTLAWLLAHMPYVQVGTGTVYGPWGRDRLAGQHAACDYPARRWQASPAALALFQRGLWVASRSLPCWTPIRVCSFASRRCSPAIVSDRGPRRATLDLWHVLARRIAHRGGDVAYSVEDLP